jgi:tripartite-type tricarboxylate transporter receptor subunit TctC
MNLNRRLFQQALACVASTAAWPALAQANDLLPSLKLLVGYPAGGTTDAAARRVAEGLRGRYAQTTMVDNRPGAGGRIALNELRRSPSDGSVMVVQPEAVLTVVPHVEPKNVTTRLEDLAPVSSCAVLRMALAVGPMVPASVRTVAEFLDWARKNPNQANYGTPGSSTPQRFLISQLSRQTQVPLNHIPYKGSAPGVIDLVGGQVAAMCSPIGDHLPHLRDGRVRILALASERRSTLAPEIPTFQEQGFADLLADETSGVVMHMGTLPEVLQRAAQAIAQVVHQPDVVQAFAKLGLEPASTSPEQYTRQIAQNHARWGQRIVDSGFKPEV